MENNGTYQTKRVLKTVISRYVFARKFCENKTVLEIGCNNGYGSSYIMSKGAKMVVGDDISSQKVGYARLKHQKQDLHFMLLDAQQLPFYDKSFDLVISYETLEHLTKQEDFVRECSRVLKDGGTFICSTPNKAVLSPNSDAPFYPEHVKELTPTEFSSMVGQYFKETTIYGSHATECF